jgi:hypothetical protein
MTMASSDPSSVFGAFTSMLTGRNAILLGGGWLAFKLLEALYNVSPLHPLSHIPGPKLAAATYWPEFYYDVVLYGRYTWQIKKWHETYGKSWIESCIGRLLTDTDLV